MFGSIGTKFGTSSKALVAAAAIVAGMTLFLLPSAPNAEAQSMEPVIKAQMVEAQVIAAQAVGAQVIGAQLVGAQVIGTQVVGTSLVRADRLPIVAEPVACSLTGWPHHEPGCEYDRRASSGTIRTVRIIAMR